MTTVSLKAHCDGEPIGREEPSPRQAWPTVSQAGLAWAGGDHEPDYSDCFGKAPLA